MRNCMHIAGIEGGVRVCGDAVLLDFWCGFWEIFILSCGIAVLQYQAVCGFQKFSGNYTAVSGFLMLFCAVFIRNSLRFCGIRTPSYAPLGSTLFFTGFSFSSFVIFLISDGTVKLTFLVVFHAL